jgi:signal transduction histidine kinase
MPEKSLIWVIRCLGKSMVVENWLLQTIGDVFNRHEKVNPQQTTEIEHSQKWDLAEIKARGEWFSGIASLEEMLLSLARRYGWKDGILGLILSSPTPLLSHPELLSCLKSGVFTPEAFRARALMPFGLPHEHSEEILSPILQLPLLPKDPILEEQFCLVMTREFGFAMALSQDNYGLPAFHFSFEPEIVEQVWATLRSRLLLTNYHQLAGLESLVEEFAPREPDYRLVMQFTRNLLKKLPDWTVSAPKKTRCVENIYISELEPRVIDLNLETATHRSETKSVKDCNIERELLQALTHEIRTPLTTIRTLTKLLLKRSAQFTGDVIKRLEAIDRECTEQIERMELIFLAAELEAASAVDKSVQLVPLSLENLFQQNIPRWQEQGQRRNVLLDFEIPQKLPTIVSDPAMLERVLTGVMENFSKSLPHGGAIKVRVNTVGDRLKLELLPKAHSCLNPFKSLGQLLMFQPETGSLSLNLDVTKNLFHLMGGKLIVRQRPDRGDVLTIFLPLGTLKG